MRTYVGICIGYLLNTSWWDSEDTKQIDIQIYVYRPTNVEGNYYL